MTVSSGFAHAPTSRRDPRPRVLLRPCGMAFSSSVHRPSKLSGKSFAVRVVCTAIIPQPISTPTAAGMIASLVGNTVPIVAPIPTCTSGITASHLYTNGIFEALINWSCAFGSTGTPLVQSLIGVPPS